MTRSRRLSERWFHRALWLVALAFAACLTGLGSLVIDDLPRVEHPLAREDFIDREDAAPLTAAIAQAARRQRDAGDALDRATLVLQATQKAYAGAREAFANWLDTRKATNLPSEDVELIGRTAALDRLKQAEGDAQQAVDAQRQTALDARQTEAAARDRLDTLQAVADRRLDAARGRAELRVFLYRLTLTLPLLAMAAWLFRTRRTSTWWPFVWGFIIFALFAFFVELVPYLPSYGGYVQYGVGLILTVVLGRGAVVALNRYLARQKSAEEEPDTLRRRAIAYDTALTRLAKGICPGCDRPVDLKGAGDFCPHCGIGLFDHCGVCATRKSSFSPYCPTCGARSEAAAAA